MQSKQAHNQVYGKTIIMIPSRERVVRTKVHCLQNHTISPTQQLKNDRTTSYSLKTNNKGNLIPSTPNVRSPSSSKSNLDGRQGIRVTPSGVSTVNKFDKDGICVSPCRSSHRPKTAVPPNGGYQLTGRNGRLIPTEATMQKGSTKGSN